MSGLVEQGGHLEGLSVADSLGGFFEFGNPHNLSHFIKTRSLPTAPWHWTDDISMALSVQDWIIIILYKTSIMLLIKRLKLKSTCREYEKWQNNKIFYIMMLIKI